MTQRGEKGKGPGKRYEEDGGGSSFTHNSRFRRIRPGTEPNKEMSDFAKKLSKACEGLIDEEASRIDGACGDIPGYVSPMRPRNVHSKGEDWYKENAENKTSANSSSQGGRHVNSSTSKEYRKMETTQNQHQGATEEEIARGAAAGAQAGAQAGAAAAGVGAAIRNWFNANRTKVGLMLGVAATLGTQAAVAAYQKNKGGRINLPGDMTLVVDGNQPGGQPGNNNAAGNAGGRGR